MELNFRLTFVCILFTIFGGASHYQYGVYNLINIQVKSFINNSFYFNYNDQLTDSQLEWSYSMLSTTISIGYAISSGFVGSLMDKFGRKVGTVFVKNPLIIVSSLLSFSSVYWNRFELLFIGRFLNGLAMGLAFFDVIFLTECAPVRSRGFVGILPTIGSRSMVVIGSAMGLPELFGSTNNWHLLFLIPAVLATIHLIVSGIILPESPRHLYIALNEEEKAKKSLVFYHGNDVEIEQIFAEYEEEKEKTDNERTVGIMKILKTRYLRWPFLLVSCITMLPTGYVGCIVMMYSMTTLESIVSPSKAALYSILLIQLPTLLVMLLGMRLITKLGRKSIFLKGFFIAIVGTVLVAASSVTSYFGFLAVVGMAFITIGQAIGPALVRKFISTELCPQISRAKTSSFGIFMDNIMDFIILALYPPMKQKYGNGIILFFTIISCLVFFFLFKYLPETRNKTVTENISRWLPPPAENIDEKTSLVKITVL